MLFDYFTFSAKLQCKELVKFWWFPKVGRIDKAKELQLKLQAQISDKLLLDYINHQCDQAKGYI